MAGDARYRWRNATRGGAILSECAEVAENLLTGSRASTVQPPLEPGTGLHLERCNTIDTSVIRAPVDVVFLDEAQRVVKTIQGVERWDEMPEYQEARSALELPAGTVARTLTQPGDLLQRDRYAAPSYPSQPPAPPETRRQPGVSLQPLQCPQCAGLVPLADGVSTTCPYCHAEVPIPTEYRELRMAARLSAADHERATAAYANLGRPPGVLLRAWAGAATGFVGVLWWSFTVFLRSWSWFLKGIWNATVRQAQRDPGSAVDVFILFAVFLVPPALLVLLLGEFFRLLGIGLHAAAMPLHVDLLAIHGPYAVYAALGLLAYLILALPVAIYGFGEAFAKVRHRLQSSLAARPPVTPGGPALCRNCGAPLDVPPGALGTRCEYCRADNLVAMPEAWVDTVQSSERMQHLEIWQAIDEEKQVRKSAARRMRKILLFSLAVIPVFACGGNWTCRAGWVPVGAVPWAKAIALGQRVERIDYHGNAAGFLERDLVTIPRDPLHPRRSAQFQVALRRGETLRIETDFDSDDAPTHVRLTDMSGKRSFSLSWSEEERAVGWFTAPFDGWYALRIQPPRDLSSDTELGWSLAKPTP